MTREKMTRMLAETLFVATEEAEAALMACDWQILEAGRLLQKQARARQLAAARIDERPRTFPEVFRSLLARVRARESAPAALELSAPVIAPLMLMPAVYACR